MEAPVALTPREARAEFKSAVQMMHCMQECLPDGQWQEVQELLECIREERPGPDDEEWLNLLADLRQIQDYWV